MQYLTKSNTDFRDASRKEDARRLREAFYAPTQDAIAREAARKLGASKRTIINWMQCQCDMPSWAVKAVLAHLERVERMANRIEGRQ